MIRNLFIAIFSSCTILCSAQIDSSSKLSFSGYGELYYSYDFSKPENHEKSSFLYNHKRHNEINANLILLKSNYSSINARANLGIMFGNYAQYNLSAEPSWAKLIYEANIGVKLSKSKSLWLDAGIMPSHIGFESAISADCWTLTRSLLAENSPYYETGVKLSYTNKKEDLNIALLALNGWQKIQRPDGIQRPSFGVQVNLKPTSKFTFNYSNFIGSDQVDSLDSWRFFHNLYVQYDINKSFGILAGLDFGLEKNNYHNTDNWSSPVLILRYIANNKTRIACRVEQYNDRDHLFITSGKIIGFSTNLDRQMNDKIQLRMEGKILHADDAIFSSTRSEDFSLTTNLTIRI